MKYLDAVAAAPPGSSTFSPNDVARLSPATLALALTPGPSAPPLEEVAAALQASPQALQRVALSLPPSRGERLLRLGQRPVAAAEREAAGARLVRGLFWPLVYELQPQRWDRLAALEPIHPAILEALPADSARVLEVGAGSGRLTLSLVSRAACLVAIEPSAPLRRLLATSLQGRAAVVGAVAQALPIRSAWADLVVSCAAFGPDQPMGGETALAELERCSRRGGSVAFVSPEQPEWLAGRGYAWTRFPLDDVELPPDEGVEAFFGPRQPLADLLIKTV